MLTPLYRIVGTTKIEIGLPPGHVMKLSGILRDANVQSWLFPLLEQVHREALESTLAEVVLDVRDLTYASADGWRSLMLWLRLIRDTPGGGFKLRLLTNLSHQWQLVGIPTLVIFGGHHLIVESSEEASSATGDKADAKGSRWKT